MTPCLTQTSTLSQMSMIQSSSTRKTFRTDSCLEKILNSGYSTTMDSLTSALWITSTQLGKCKSLCSTCSMKLKPTLLVVSILRLPSSMVPGLNRALKHPHGLGVQDQFGKDMMSQKLPSIHVQTAGQPQPRQHGKIQQSNMFGMRSQRLPPPLQHGKSPQSNTYGMRMSQRSQPLLLIGKSQQSNTSGMKMSHRLPPLLLITKNKMVVRFGMEMIQRRLTPKPQVKAGRVKAHIQVQTCLKDTQLTIIRDQPRPQVNHTTGNLETFQPVVTFQSIAMFQNQQLP